jgi:hypothetical protein
VGNNQGAPGRYDGAFNSDKSIPHPQIITGIYGKSKLTILAFSF